MRWFPRPIAANDDAIRSVRLILQAVSQAITQARAEFESKKSRRINEEAAPAPAPAPTPTAAEAAVPAGSGPRARGRSSRGLRGSPGGERKCVHAFRSSDSQSDH